ncbi:MAG: SGNH/GDSL hydrolase family protein [Acutalibacteraceae bacterium]|nr:SGNH/GDSL hydrolase family protein [Acutalibacteraceae bacterium]
MEINTTKNNEKPLDNIVNDGGYTAIFRTISCIGDSLSSGEFESVKEDGTKSYHDIFEYSWGQFLARTCGSCVYNMSRGGMTAKEYIDSFADSNGFFDAKYASQAYIMALGVNDLFGIKQPVGTTDDINFDDPSENNTDTFAGCYAYIIQKYKSIQPRSKFFLVTMPRDNGVSAEFDELKKEHSRLLYELAEKFDNTYVIDLNRYAPVYDESFKEQFYLGGHLNPMGYILTAKMIASYIDYIIRHNMNDFREVGFIGTSLHG